MKNLVAIDHFEETMEITRTQYAVGQGGFHVAALRTGHKTFRYIYDCGALPKGPLIDAIKNVPAEDRAVDWLVISSFDADHFNGIKDLISNGFTFKACILPHRLDKDLFKYVFLGQLLNKEGEIHLETMAKAFLGILDGEFGAVIPGNIAESSDGDLVNSNALSRNFQDGQFSVSYPVKDTNWVFRFYSVEAKGETLMDKIFSIPCLVPLRDNIDKLANALADNKPWSEVEASIQRVKQALSDKPLAAAINATVKLPEWELKKEALTGRTTKKILDLIFRRSKKIFDLIEDYNSASLCMYSGPNPHLPERKDTRPYYSRSDRDISYWSYRNGKSLHIRATAAGWLSVGDITFKNEASVDSFLSHYFHELPLAGTRSLPHHGAQSNYDEKFLSLKRLAKNCPKKTLWLACSDPVNGGHRHPDGAVVLEYGQRGKVLMIDAQPENALIEKIWID